jgi:hypothetical protein
MSVCQINSNVAYRQILDTRIETTPNMSRFIFSILRIIVIFLRNSTKDKKYWNSNEVGGEGLFTEKHII